MKATVNFAKKGVKVMSFTKVFKVMDVEAFLAVGFKKNVTFIMNEEHLGYSKKDDVVVPAMKNSIKFTLAQLLSQLNQINCTDFESVKLVNDGKVDEKLLSIFKGADVTVKGEAYTAKDSYETTDEDSKTIRVKYQNSGMKYTITDIVLDKTSVRRALGLCALKDVNAKDIFDMIIG